MEIRFVINRPSSPRAGRAAAAPLLVAMLVVAGLLPGCGKGGAGSPAVPTVDLAGVEPALAARIEERSRAVAADPDDAEAWGRLGVAFDVHGYTQEAIACYEQAVALDDAAFPWHYLLGYALHDTDATAALAHLERARELRDDYAPVHCLIGQLHVEANRIDDADDSFARALALDDDMAATLLGRTRVALAREDHEAAMFYLERAEKLEPRELEMYALLARAHEMAGNPGQALRFATDAGDDWQREPMDDPFRDELWRSEGVTMEWRHRRSSEYVTANDVGKLAAEWQEAMREDPASAVPHVELGRAYGAVGQYELALESFESAIALDPASAEAHFGRGGALILLGRRDEGFEAIRTALGIDPLIRGARRTLANEMTAEGEVEAALDVLRAGIEAAPDDAEAHYDLGTALRRQGRREEALAALDRALEIDPELTPATFERAMILGAEGDLEAAVAGFEKAAAEAPRIAGSHMNLGQAYLALGRTGAAVEAFRLGVTLHPNSRPLLRALAWIHATNPDEQHRNGDVAVRLGQQACALSRYSNPTDLDVLAAACAERGDWEVADRYASNAIKLMSDRLEKETDPATRQQIEQQMMEVQQRLEGYLEKQPYRDTR